LPKKKRGADFDFVGARSAIVRRPTFYRIADIDVLPFEPYGLDHLVQELAGPPHKRPPLLILIMARPFAYKHELGFWGTLAEHQVGPSLVQSATSTITQLVPNLMEKLPGIQCGRLFLIQVRDCWKDWGGECMVGLNAAPPQARQQVPKLSYG
jgi:hypothetical protein